MILLENGAVVNAQTNNGTTALIVASENGHISVCKILLERGALVDAQDSVRGANLDLRIKMALRHAGNLYNLWKKKHLHRTIYSTGLLKTTPKGHRSVCKILLKNGAVVNAQTNKGTTALIVVSGNGHISVLKILLERGDLLDAQDSVRQGSFFEKQRWFYGPNSSILKSPSQRLQDTFKKWSCSICTVTNNGTTALIVASGNGHISVLKILLERGDLLDAKDSVRQGSFLNQISLSLVSIASWMDSINTCII
ncbi:ankyrin repeat domain-containing protein 50-like [Anneissia japonica]|uniref:ankyrin repeat domain-containing protein 50-like n=1 Tax=Anneissia japonica TaxID=1529436 RepID=UPI0014259D42|nr:ankyrin repeat domain-containing protein 50-like [Anneissia japonica]